MMSSAEGEKYALVDGLKSSLVEEVHGASSGWVV